MTKNECKAVRSEIDEANVNNELPSDAKEHLRVCVSCRSFHLEQRALQGLLANLNTVAAPSDFDFRLRARLARDQSRTPSLGRLSIIPRSLAAAALVFLIAVAGVVVKNWLSSGRTMALATKPSTSIDHGKLAIEPASIVNPDSTKDRPLTVTTRNTGPVTAGAEPSPRSDLTKHYPSRNSLAIVRKGVATATREFGVTPAPVLVRVPETGDGSPVLVPLTSRALKISVDNGRGISRTISLPTVSFGSQRLMTRESFVAPVSAPKGVW